MNILAHIFTTIYKRKEEKLLELLRFFVFLSIGMRLFDYFHKYQKIKFMLKLFIKYFLFYETLIFTLTNN